MNVNHLEALTRMGFQIPAHPKTPEKDILKSQAAEATRLASSMVVMALPVVIGDFDRRLIRFANGETTKRQKEEFIQDMGELFPRALWRQRREVKMNRRVRASDYSYEINGNGENGQEGDDLIRISPEAVIGISVAALCAASSVSEVEMTGAEIYGPNAEEYLQRTDPNAWNLYLNGSFKPASPIGR